MMKGWETVTLESVCTKVTDGTHDTPEVIESGFPLIKGKDISKGFIDFENCDHVSEAEHLAIIKRSKPEKGDVLFANIGNSIGDCVYVNTDRPFSIKNVALFKPDHRKIVPRFLYYIASGEKFIGEILAGKSGAAQPFISLAALRRHPVVIPPLPIQQKIAEILAAYDDLIENNLKRIKLLEEMAQITYEEWFVRLRFPGHESTTINPETSLPIGWERARLQDLLVLQRGFDLPTKDRIEGAVPVYASTGVTGFHNQVKVKAPGVMTGRSGTLGHVMYSNIDFWPLNTTLWVKEFKGISPIFAYYLLKSLNFENYNSGVAVPTLNRNDVHLVHVLKPEERIVDLFTDNLNPIFVLLDKLKDQNQRLREARDILLPRLMTGVIDVENYDPAQLLKEAA